jgi:hypothetical protein
METTITKKLKGLQMEMLFEAQTPLNVKFYRALGISNADYLRSKSYTYEITIRHGENENAQELFDSTFQKMFQVKQNRIPKKRIFLCSTEVGRKKGRISFYIAEIMPNKGLKLIDNDYTCSSSSHKGLESEAVQALVNKNELPITAINASHYRDGRVKNYSLIMVQGTALNYINQIN